MASKKRKKKLVEVLLWILVMAVLGVIGVSGVYIYNIYQEKQEFRERGIQAYEAENYKEAIEDMQISLSINGPFVAPLDRDSRLYLADSLFLAGRYVEAIDQYNKLLLSEESQIDYLILQKTVSQGMVDYNKQNYEDALPAFRRAVEAGHLECALYAGVCAGENGLQEDMIEYFLEYLEYDPNSAYCYDRLADYYFTGGDYETAKQYIDSGLACEDHSCDAQLRWLLLSYYEYQKDYNTAYELILDYISDFGTDNLVRKEYDFLVTRQTIN